MPLCVVDLVKSLTKAVNIVSWTSLRLVQDDGSFRTGIRSRRTISLWTSVICVSGWLLSWSSLDQAPIGFDLSQDFAEHTGSLIEPATHRMSVACCETRVVEEEFGSEKVGLPSVFEEIR